MFRRSVSSVLRFKTLDCLKTSSSGQQLHLQLQLSRLEFLQVSFAKMATTTTSTTTNSITSNGNGTAKVIPKCTHVLFDFDGTLVNSIDRIIEVVDQMIQRENPSLRITEKIKDYVPNLSSFQSLVTLINSELGLALDPDASALYIGREARSGLKLLPGVERLVRHLHANGIPMAVATGAGSENYAYGVANFPAFFATYISHAVCAYDDPEVKRRKPAPDCYHVAASRFASPPTDMSRVIVFEDSITGLTGALASGGQTVFVSSWPAMFTEASKPLRDRAALVIDSLEQFVPEAFGLPPYKDV